MLLHRFWGSVVLVGILGAASGAAASEAVSAIEDLSLEELLNMTTGVASRQEKPLREAPALVTVITRAEIMALGARDLQDVLLSIAGFSLAADVETVVDVGFRGIWAHEGKLLLLLDGQEVNEPLFSTLQLGNHFLLQNIERIEIVRGPGSALYGGMAELGVINIITRDATAAAGLSLQADYGQRRDDYARRTVQASYGKTWNDKLALVVHGAWGQGHRSDETVRDFDGDSYKDTGGNGRIDPGQVALKLRYEGLKVQLLYDNYRTTDKFSYGAILQGPALPVTYITYAGDAQYDLVLSEKVTVTPRVNVKYQEPWHNADATPDSFSGDYYTKYNVRSYANVTVKIDPIDSLNIQAGVQATWDHAYGAMGPPGSNNILFDGGTRTTVDYENYAVFAQALLDTPWVNITAGARYELHSVYGSSFVPRVGLTRVFDAFHFKALASGAFRAPGIENIRLDPQVHPERTWAFELEAGYLITEGMYAAVSAYDVTVDDIIIYTVTDDGSEVYANAPRMGSRGFDVEYRIKDSWGFANATYSYNNAADKNQASPYQVPQNGSYAVGLPDHKVVVSGALNVGEHVSIGPSVVVLGPRYGAINAADTFDATPWTTLLNAFVTYKDAGVDGLDVSLGGYNLLGQNFSYLQAYSGGAAPLPGLSREVMLRLAFHTDV